MTANRGKRLPPSVVPGAAILIGAALLLAGLVGVDYRGALAAALGVAAAVVAVQVWRFARRSRRRAVLIGVAVLLVAVAGSVVVLSSPVMTEGESAPALEPAPPSAAEEGAGPSGPRLELLPTGYRATIRPAEPAGAMLISEEVFYEVRKGARLVYASQVLAFPERTVLSERRGFMLREVSVQPLGSGALSPTAFTLPDGSQVVAPLCTRTACPPGEVRVEGLPERSFFAARGVADVATVPYVRTETVSWATPDLSAGIAFAYVPSPFQAFRPLLQPFIGASSLNDWLVGLIALVTGVLAAPLIMPVVEYIGERALGRWLGRLRRRDGDAPPRAA